MHRDVKVLLEKVAPQLATFEAVFDCYDSYDIWTGSSRFVASDFLTSTLAALRDVQVLSLGILGFDFSATLRSLRSLLHLRSLFIGRSAMAAATGPFHELTSTAAIDFIVSAVALESLTLPRQMKEVWTNNQLAQVEAAAQTRGIRFMLG